MREGEREGDKTKTGFEGGDFHYPLMVLPEKLESIFLRISWMGEIYCGERRKPSSGAKISPDGSFPSFSPALLWHHPKLVPNVDWAKKKSEASQGFWRDFMSK